MDLKELATKAAVYANSDRFEDHRGAMVSHGYTAVFGNDGYTQDEDTGTEVEVLRQLLDEAGIAEVAFAIEPDGKYSWALLVRSDDVAALQNMIWRAHGIAKGLSADDPLYKVFKKVQGCAIAE